MRTSPFDCTVVTRNPTACARRPRPPSRRMPGRGSVAGAGGARRHRQPARDGGDTRARGLNWFRASLFDRASHQKRISWMAGRLLAGALPIPDRLGLCGSAPAVVTVLAVALPMPTAAAQQDNPGKGLAKGHAKGVVIVGYEPGTSKVKRGQAARLRRGDRRHGHLPSGARHRGHEAAARARPSRRPSRSSSSSRECAMRNPTTTSNPRSFPTTPTTRMAVSGACTATPSRPMPTVRYRCG